MASRPRRHKTSPTRPVSLRIPTDLFPAAQAMAKNSGNGSPGTWARDAIVGILSGTHALIPVGQDGTLMAMELERHRADIVELRAMFETEYQRLINLYEVHAALFETLSDIIKKGQ